MNKDSIDTNSRLIKARTDYYSELHHSHFPDKRGLYEKLAMRDVDERFTSKDLKEIEGQIRGMIEHENDLLNHRIQWFLIINGFLLTATATLKTKQLDDGKLILIAIAAIGILVCVSFWFSLGIGMKGVGRLAKTWEYYVELFAEKSSDGCHHIGVIGWWAKEKASKVSAWFILPIIFALVWIFLLIAHVTSKTVSTLDGQRLRIMQPVGKSNGIVVDTSAPSTSIIIVPNLQGQSRAS